MIFGHYHANWWLSGDLNGCTPEEMSAAVEGAVSVGFQTLSKKNVETVGKIVSYIFSYLFQKPLIKTRREHQGVPARW